MAGDNDGDEMRTYQGKIRPMASGMGSSGPFDMRDGRSGEAAMDGSRGDNPQRPQGTTGPGRDPDDHTARSEGSTRRPGENRLAKFRDSGEGSTGSGISAVQAPNRPR